jgi:hypothetical protein
MCGLWGAGQGATTRKGHFSKALQTTQSAPQKSCNPPCGEFTQKEKSSDPKIVVDQGLN